MRFCIIAWAIVGFTGSSYSQSDTLSLHQFIKGAAAYREQFIASISDAFLELGYLSDSLKNYSADPDAHDLFRKRFMERFSKGKAYNIQGAIDAAMPVSIQGEKGTRIVYRQWGWDHMPEIIQMHFLVSNGIILQGEPFSLTSNPEFWEEVHFYDLREGQIFIDVGAGIGGVSYLLAFSGISIQFYLTEISDLYFENLLDQMKRMPVDEKDTQIQLVVAREKTLGLSADIKADRILMREVYHHLDYPYHVLADVREHLDPEGILILVESVKDLKENRKEGCKKALSLKKVKKEVGKNGFVLTGQKYVNDSYVLKFKLAKN